MLSLRDAGCFECRQLERSDLISRTIRRMFATRARTLPCCDMAVTPSYPCPRSRPVEVEGAHAGSRYDSMLASAIGARTHEPRAPLNLDRRHHLRRRHSSSCPSAVRQSGGALTFTYHVVRWNQRSHQGQETSTTRVPRAWRPRPIIASVSSDFSSSP